MSTLVLCCLSPAGRFVSNNYSEPDGIFPGTAVL